MKWILIFALLIPFAYADVTAPLNVTWTLFAHPLYTGRICVGNTSVFGPFDDIILEYSLNDHSGSILPSGNLSLQDQGNNVYCENLTYTWDSTPVADTLDPAELTVKSGADIIFQDDVWSTDVPDPINDPNHLFRQMQIVCFDFDNDGYYGVTPACDIGDDCNDGNSAINPNAIELCNGIDDDCDGAIDEGFDADNDTAVDCFDNCPIISNPDQLDNDGDGIGDVCDDDLDGDGTIDTDDCIIGFSDYIDSNFEIEIRAANLINTSTFENGLVNLTYKNATIIEFDFNCSLGKLWLNLIKITKNNESDSEGHLTASRINLTRQNTTKTFYVDNQDNTTDLICILDEEVDSVNDIASNCGNGISITCDNENGTNATNNGRVYTCSKLDRGYKISGLSYSGVKEYTYVAPPPPSPGGGGGGGGSSRCSPSWECTEWSSCSAIWKRQTRTCTDTKNCGKDDSKPEETQMCTPKTSLQPSTITYVSEEENIEGQESVDEEPTTQERTQLIDTESETEGLTGITGAPIVGSTTTKNPVIGIVVILSIVILGTGIRLLFKVRKR